MYNDLCSLDHTNRKIPPLQTSATINKSISSILIEENKFIEKEIGLSALCDLINLERLFYGFFQSVMLKS